VLFRGSNSLTNGGHRPGKVELVDPITVALEYSYSERWIRKKIDPVELVTLRASGLTCEEIAARFGWAKSTIWRHLPRTVEDR
jgi:hypothetical protein